MSGTSLWFSMAVGLIVGTRLDCLVIIVMSLVILMVSIAIVMTLEVIG
jgi:hypothetical protein